ncbi:MAG: family 78 glycoside hydrolase catalytic domain [Clostridiaceae bacterium]|nr:family 78 glycoside hydrolase catalytic domain [Clostridiaceae bacterium]
MDKGLNKCLHKGLKIYGLSCNYLENPIGIDSKPRFSWKLYSDTRGQRQAAYRLLVSSSREKLERGIYDAWDSGKIASSDNIHISYAGKALLPRTRYWWKVVAYDMEDMPFESDVAFFETGKMDEEWTAKWITAGYIRNEATAYAAPLLRTSFELDCEPAEARLYICGLGYFYAWINGEKPSDDVLSTAFTRYDSTVLYLTYDVTELLKAGKNAIGIILGNGWYNCFAEDPWNTRQATWRHWPKVIAELHVKLPDGSRMVITTDQSWKSAKSPITFNGIRNGEYYDARLEIPGWNTPGFDDSGWEPAKIIRPPGGVLRAFELQPIRITKELAAARKWQSPSGTCIFDMGQNFSGVVRIKVKGKAGTEVVIRYSDLLKEDNVSLNQAPIAGFVRSGEFQTDKYIKKGDGVETWQPVFVYHGFQYVELSGLDYEPGLDAVTGLVMHTGFEERGHFRCSDETLNTIQKHCYWATVSNYHGIPTDCPHREKNGWTGDASLSAEQALLNFAPMAAYVKWMRDFKDSQKPNGAIPCVVPSTGWGYNWGNGPDWSSALTLIPWYIYTYCGDRVILGEMYDAIKKHCDFITGMAENYIVHYGIGDWCPPFEGPAISVNMSSFKTPTALTDTAYYYKTAETLSRIARILGREEDAEKYGNLAEKIKEAFRREFFKKDERGMKVAGDCQTSTACMLYQGLAEDNEKEALLKLLLSQIEEKDYHIDFGILGNKYVMNTLGEGGHAGLGIRMITQDTFPSFKKWIDMGATTLWECWNGGGSHNHHAFSDVSAFMYKYIGGILPDENEPGFKHIILRPALECGLSYVECRHESMYGGIECNWTNSGDKVTIEISVPVNAHATLYLPSSYDGKVMESGESIEGVFGINACIKGDKLVLTLVSGKYKFEISR